MRWLLLPLLFLIFSSPVKAGREIFITSDKNLISVSDEMVVTASVSGFATDEAVFVKSAFYKDGSTNYFGFTKKYGEWVKNSAEVLSQLNVNISSWDKYIIAKIDPEDSGFSGTGEYKFKLGYYYTTQNGNISSVNWSSNNLVITLLAPTPSATPVPSFSPVPATPFPLPSTKILNFTFTPSPSAEKIKQKIISTAIPIDPTPTVLNESNILLESNDQDVLGQSTSQSSDLKNNNTLFLPIFIIGVAFILMAIVSSYKILKSTQYLR